MLPQGHWVTAAVSAVTSRNDTAKRKSGPGFSASLLEARKPFPELPRFPSHLTGELGHRAEVQGSQKRGKGEDLSKMRV